MRRTELSYLTPTTSQPNFISLFLLQPFTSIHPQKRTNKSPATTQDDEPPTPPHSRSRRSGHRNRPHADELPAASQIPNQPQHRPRQRRLQHDIPAESRRLRLPLQGLPAPAQHPAGQGRRLLVRRPDLQLHHHRRRCPRRRVLPGGHLRRWGQHVSCCSQLRRRLPGRGHELVPVCGAG